MTNTSTPNPTTSEELRKCSTCGLEKPLSEYTLFKGKKRPRCDACRALYERRPKDSATKVVELPQIVWPRDPDGRLAIAVKLRMECYKERAIDAIFELAMMPPNENAFLMQVKMAAASKLAGPLPGDASMIAAGARPTLELDPFLKQLSEAYQATRPRLREIRERVAVFEDTPQLQGPTDDNPS